MSKKIKKSNRRLTAPAVAMSMMAAAVVGAKPSLAQTAEGGSSSSLHRGSEAEKALKLEEPHFEKREERLKAKPLDWNSTIGVTKPRTLTEEEERALREAKPSAAEGGKPHPNAKEEARKLHPEEQE